ncbi:50S ribosomal protein L21, mitochondrial-like [Iris pallida]|uniref:Large ribosomal subunit protein bL21m n=1 Tax=Iris pallida TaxID=29817 RepID=A0AAX6EHB6_IRIPA|nr:50S ribosomal protein L21, mitochondrial-like [Iris pallida]
MTTRTTLTKRWTRKTTTMTTARAPMVGHEVLSKREVGGGEGLGGGRHRLQSGRAAGSFGEAFQAWEPVFAVVQIGSHQFKVSNGDSIFTERLKFCEVNDKLILNKVLMLGSRTQTVIGRPILPDSAVHAVIEEHALDAKVIIFKKKRRKNYRRTKGHRQELTKLRITDIQGIEKSEGVAVAA